ncbi:ATP-dependent Clp protease proteolytic subunit [Roseibacillus persicicus]|uniref:Peptidase S14 n=2 Tax=Roseibacillus persicicus TaxID=454148 RepID=A0A918TXB4_9BACT|nr:hypothetical protein GCM10007100_35260 [Roseibacillus persicicus]
MTPPESLNFHEPGHYVHLGPFDMKTTTNRALAMTASAFILTGSILSADQSQTNTPVNLPAETKNLEKAETEKPAPKKKPSKEEIAKARMEKEKSRLALENALAAEESKMELNELRQQVSRLKLEKELLAETLAVAELKQKKEMADDAAQFREETAELTREMNVAKMQAEKMTAQLKATQAEFGLEMSALEREIKTIEAKYRRDNYTQSEPVYLEEPFLDDGTLVISDRRIDLNGPIFSGTADHVSERINYFNNKDTEYPIFIVIDNSPGGSVMSGMSIMKAMHGSEAPVYVVVKTFAASMAASLTTLAERSFAFPNAVILHHQILSGNHGNLTETREHTRMMEEWWRRLANPIAKKMGISREEFIKKMYQETVTGDWTEFADQAKKLKWVDHVVSNIRETSLVKNPDAKRSSTASPNASVTSTPENIIPRLNPMDVLYMYNPDGYYQQQK